MPIEKQEFRNGKLHNKVEEEIVTFLNERAKRAYTSQEIMDGINYHTEFTTPEITKRSTFAIADFTAFLHQLAMREKVKMKIVRGRMYYMAGEHAAKCPRCKVEMQPRKTWKMAGRPNSKGFVTELHIGFYKCPNHGAFRTVLGKKKIPAAKKARAKGKVNKAKTKKNRGKKRRNTKQA